MTQCMGGKKCATSTLTNPERIRVRANWHLDLSGEFLRKLNTYLHTSFGEQKLLIKNVFWLQIASAVRFFTSHTEYMGALNYFSHVWQISVMTEECFASFARCYKGKSIPEIC